MDATHAHTPPSVFVVLVVVKRFQVCGRVTFCDAKYDTKIPCCVVELHRTRTPPPAVYFQPLALATPPSSGLTLKVLYAGEVCARPRRPFTTPVMGAVPQAWLMVPDVKACGKKRKKSARRKKRGVKNTDCAHFSRIG